jgi:hypothetical protein
MRRDGNLTIVFGSMETFGERLVVASLEVNFLRISVGQYVGKSGGARRERCKGNGCAGRAESFEKSATGMRRICSGSFTSVSSHL